MEVDVTLYKKEVCIAREHIVKRGSSHCLVHGTMVMSLLVLDAFPESFMCCEHFILIGKLRQMWRAKLAIYTVLKFLKIFFRLLSIKRSRRRGGKWIKTEQCGWLWVDVLVKCI